MIAYKTNSYFNYFIDLYDFINQWAVISIISPDNEDDLEIADKYDLEEAAATEE